jgi:probable F420-dependent oxidoreductase
MLRGIVRGPTPDGPSIAGVAHMRYGLTFFPTEYAIAPAELARAAEERGFESLFFTEHTHIPASRVSPYPAGGELPREYSHTYDPFVALMSAAAATTDLGIGTAISLVVQHDPIVLAKTVATLDQLSGGRFLFGVGAGWNLEEMSNHGTDPNRRFALMGERVKAMRAIWAEDEASFHGELVDFDRIWSWPKPLQRPGPPVIVGGQGPKVLQRVVEYGDEWLPIHFDPLKLQARIAELQHLAEEAERGPVPVTLWSLNTDPAPPEHYSQAGVHRVLFQLPTVPRDDALTWLDALAAKLPPR